MLTFGQKGLWELVRGWRFYLPQHNSPAHKVNDANDTRWLSDCISAVENRKFQKFAFYSQGDISDQFAQLVCLRAVTVYTEILNLQQTVDQVETSPTTVLLNGKALLHYSPIHTLEAAMRGANHGPSGAVMGLSSWLTVTLISWWAHDYKTLKAFEPLFMKLPFPSLTTTKHSYTSIHVHMVPCLRTLRQLPGQSRIRSANPLIIGWSIYLFLC